jgi:putative membrane protein
MPFVTPSKENRMRPMLPHMILFTLALSTMAWAQANTPTTNSADPPTSQPTQPSDSPTVNDFTIEELELIARLHHDNQMEAEMGKLAAERSKTDSIKQYGRRLTTDHQRADKDLTALAKARKLTIKTPTPRNEPERKEMEAHQMTMQRIRDLQGADFDREYLTMMMADHKKALDLVKSTKVKDAKLKTLVEKVQPVLQRHHDAASALLKQVSS